MDKYLLLNFTDAGLFKSHEVKTHYIDAIDDEGNKIILGNGKFKKKAVKKAKGNFKEPITVHQITNVIHSLFGERPVPTLRPVHHKLSQYYIDKANDSFLRIDNHMVFHKKKNIFEYTTEKISTNKSKWNSFNAVADMNWFKVEKYLQSVVKINDNFVIAYDEFIKECNILFGYNVRTKSLSDLKDNFKMIPESKYTHILDILKGKNPLILYISDKNGSGVINQAYKYGLTRNINSGIDGISKLRGSIFVPVNDDDIERLRDVSTGTCTILDGGLVTIDSIQDSYEIELLDYKKVSEISTDKND